MFNILVDNVVDIYAWHKLNASAKSYAVRKRIMKYASTRKPSMSPITGSFTMDSQFILSSPYAALGYCILDSKICPGFSSFVFECPHGLLEQRVCTSYSCIHT